MTEMDWAASTDVMQFMLIAGVGGLAIGVIMGIGYMIGLEQGYFRGYDDGQKS